MSGAEKSRIIHGDVLEVLRELSPDETFDVVIADPPYNIGKDFGNNHDAMPLDRYVEWSQEWIAECLRRLKPSGLLYIYGFPEILARVSANYDIDGQRWLQWHYTNKTVPSSRFWQRSHESILCLWRRDEKRPALEIDQIREPYKPAYLKIAGKTRKETFCRYNSGGRSTVYNAHKNGALPRDVIKAPALAGGAGHAERWFVCRTCGGRLFRPEELAEHRQCDTLKHPTQKPMEVARRLILSRVNGDGGRVLVPFAGSGSECLAAQEMGLEYVGIELNPEYVDFANQWLARQRNSRKGRMV